MARKFYKRRNVFTGADDIYLTNKHIAVRRLGSFTNKKGQYVYTDKTTYYKLNKKNLNKANDLYGYIRKGR